jgi:glycosyltransferase involved in cell wall biosynthesis
MSKPKISVITATFNDGDHLRVAIESILNQTFTDFEYIIVDDASTDGTEGLIASLNDERIIPLRNGTNQGRAISRNRALDIAKGEFIAIMDGDDISHHERFEKQLSYFERNPDIGYIGSAIKIIDKDSGEFIRYNQFPSKHDHIAWTLLYLPPFMHPSTMGRRKFFIQAGGYDPAYPRGQDVDMWTRMIHLTKTANMPEQLLTYRHRRGESWNKIHRPSLTYAREIHHKYASQMLGNGIPDNIFNIMIQTRRPLMNLDCTFNNETIIEATQTILSIYTKMSERGYFTAASNIVQEDLIEWLVLILRQGDNFADKVFRRLKKEELKPFSKAYFKSAFPSPFFKFAEMIMHPIKLFERFLHPKKD